MVERIYPGVYMQEVSFAARSIEGVPTSTAGLVGEASDRDAAARVPPHTPEWTNPPEGDPGVTILELLAYALDASLFRSVATGAVGGPGDCSAERESSRSDPTDP